MADERDHVVERLLDGLEPPPPPPQLRSRVLDAAHDRLQMDSTDSWSRIWYHRGARLAWAAAVVVLLAVHVLVGLRQGTGGLSITPELVAENHVDEHLVHLLRPVQISANAKPIVGLFAAARGVDDPDEGGNPS